jgi:hydrogenase maturation factor
MGANLTRPNEEFLTPEQCSKSIVDAIGANMNITKPHRNTLTVEECQRELAQIEKAGYLIDEYKSITDETEINRIYKATHAKFIAVTFERTLTSQPLTELTAQDKDLRSRE